MTVRSLISNDLIRAFSSWCLLAVRLTRLAVPERSYHFGTSSSTSGMIFRCLRVARRVPLCPRSFLSVPDYKPSISFQVFPLYSKYCSVISIYKYSRYEMFLEGSRIVESCGNVSRICDSPQLISLS